MKSKLHGWVLTIVICCRLADGQPAPRLHEIPGKLATSVEGSLLIAVTVNGKGFWCAADSGGGVFSLDEKKGAAAGFHGDSAGHSSGVGPAVVSDQRMHGATIQIGDITLREQTIVMRPYPREVPDMDCVLGTGLLRNYIVEFDYSTPAVRLYDPEQFAPPERAMVIPFRLDRNTPVGEATIEFGDGAKLTASLALDTGAAFYTSVLMPRFIAKSNVRQHAARTARRPDHPKGTGGEVSVLSTRPARIRFGESTVEGPILGLVETESAGFPWDGLLGSAFFSRFTSSFDYPNRRLYLIPNQNAAARSDFDASGVGFERRDDAYVVDVVLPDTPASAAGLQEGEVLISIDGVPAGHLDPVELRHRLSRGGKECRLLLRHDNSEHVTILHLADRL